MRKLPLILVEWNDTCTSDNWKREKDCKHSEAHCVSVGWRLKSDRNFLTITTMRDGDGGCNDRQTIPKGCIKSIRRLE